MRDTAHFGTHSPLRRLTSRKNWYTHATSKHKTIAPNTLIHLETPRLGCCRDTGLFSLIGSSLRTLSTGIDSTHGLDLSLGLLVTLPLFNTRVSVGLGSPRGETTILLDRPSECSGAVRTLGSHECSSGMPVMLATNESGPRRFEPTFALPWHRRGPAAWLPFRPFVVA
jgi:hypothetical protein